MVKIHRQCNICGKFKELQVSEVGYSEWLEGAHIQDALPELSVDDRELLISGICGTCFDEIFREDPECEDEEDDDEDDEWGLD